MTVMRQYVERPRRVWAIKGTPENEEELLGYPSVRKVGPGLYAVGGHVVGPGRWFVFDSFNPGGDPQVLTDDQFHALYREIPE